MVKLYADEPGSAELAGLGELVVSILARVEVPSALWRKHRAGELTLGETTTLVAAFERDLRGTTASGPRFLVSPVGPSIADAAATLCATDGLRAYDAVQLATLLALRDAIEISAFACFDRQLRAAAAQRGVALAPA